MCDRDQKPKLAGIRLWLLITALLLPFTMRYASAADEARPADEQTVSTNTIPLELPTRITTLDGKTYEKVTLEKVAPDGLLVSFTPAEGGSGVAKLKFQNLPSDLRERYGYDPNRVLAYEAAQAQGTAAWVAQSVVWAQQRQAAQAEQAAWERQMQAEAEARRALVEEEQARAAADNAQQEPPYYYPGWWGYGIYDSFPRHRHKGDNHNHVSHRTPNVGIKSSPISPIIGPMRPLGK